MGEGGSIPFMGMLGEKFPEAQFLITGVLGPHSNAHGPNEFLHIPTGKRVTMVVADVLAQPLRQGRLSRVMAAGHARAALGTRRVNVWMRPAARWAAIRPRSTSCRSARPIRPR